MIVNNEPMGIHIEMPTNHSPLEKKRNEMKILRFDKKIVYSMQIVVFLVVR